MGKFAGGFLRTTTTFVYFLAFLCSAIGLALYSYFLAKLSYHHLSIANTWRAVEGITGAAVLYTIFAVILTCFLGGKAFFALLALILDIAFCGAFIAVAVLTRDGASSCSTNAVIKTPLGTGIPSSEQAGTRQSTACRMNTAVFATAIAAAILFLIAAVLQFMLMKNHRKEQKFGPSPANNYTSGSGNRKFWQKKPKTTKDVYANGTSAELGTVGAGTNPGLLAAAHHDNRISHETGYTGTTADGGDHLPTTAKYETSHSGYNVGPTTNGNPYGYNNSTHPTGTAVNY